MGSISARFPRRESVNGGDSNVTPSPLSRTLLSSSSHVFDPLSSPEPTTITQRGAPSINAPAYGLSSTRIAETSSQRNPVLNTPAAQSFTHQLQYGSPSVPLSFTQDTDLSSVSAESNRPAFTLSTISSAPALTPHAAANPASIPPTTAVGGTAGSRRQREESTSPQKRQRRRLLATEVALDLGLQDVVALQEFSQLDIYGMLIYNQAYAMKHAEVDKARQIGDALRSQEWANRFELRLAVALASDTTAFYSVGTADHLLLRMFTNLRLWELPEGLKDSASDWSKFVSLLKELLTSLRGAFKQKNQHISVLATAIANRKGAHMIIKRSHWARYAFLRECYRKFHLSGSLPAPPLNARSGKASYGKDNYWEYVDDMLQDIRQAAAGELDPKVHEATHFATVLTEDIARYPGVVSEANSMQSAGGLLPFQTAFGSVLEIE